VFDTSLFRSPMFSSSLGSSLISFAVPAYNKVVNPVIAPILIVVGIRFLVMAFA
jgi:hypothetical protein